MKDAVGELNMTVITVVAIAAIAALFYAFVWPTIQQSIASNTCKAAYGEDYEAVKQEQLGETKAAGWDCCENGTTNCHEMPAD